MYRDSSKQQVTPKARPKILIKEYTLLRIKLRSASFKYLVNILSQDFRLIVCLEKK